MRIDLVCEYLFTRKAYDEIKPEPVKLILEQSAQSQGMGMGAGVGGMQ
jgi:hypothetical protein